MEDQSHQTKDGGYDDDSMKDTNSVATEKTGDASVAAASVVSSTPPLEQQQQQQSAPLAEEGAVATSEAAAAPVPTPAPAVTAVPSPPPVLKSEPTPSVADRAKPLPNPQQSTQQLTPPKRESLSGASSSGSLSKAGVGAAAGKQLPWTPSVEQVREHMDSWLDNILSKEDSEQLRILLKDYDSLKDKVGKLKSLLGRSAKAQREAKVDLEATQKRLDQALREIDRLNKKIDKLANRPTHMELLADFETNFDRALLSVGQQQQQQAGGQDTAQPATNKQEKEDTAVVDSLLLQELNESKQRIEKLENLNSALLHRSSHLETEVKERRRERDELFNQVSRLELEKRMAVMEAEHATKAMQEKATALAEMQMEIDLVTKASVNANARAAQGEEMIKSVKTDKQQVQQLEAKVQALQEWAVASNEAKVLAQERVRLLESQLRAMQTGAHNKSTSSTGDDTSERVLLSKSASMVVGAGLSGCVVLSLPLDVVKTVKLSERVLLRWQFDLIQADATIHFSILKSTCETQAQQKNADYLVKDRMVTGGAAGETENAFAIQNACTLLWSNENAWVRPKTVKYQVTAVAIAY